MNLEVVAACHRCWREESFICPIAGWGDSPSILSAVWHYVCAASALASGASVASATSSPPQPTAATLRHFSHLFLFLEIKVPPAVEVEEILAARFPSLPAAAKVILKTYRLFNGAAETDAGQKGDDSMVVEGESEAVADEEREKGSSEQTVPLRKLIASSRQFTLRDLMKVAGRCERYSDEVNKGSSSFLTEAQKRALLSEVVDVFAASARHANRTKRWCVDSERCGAFPMVRSLGPCLRPHRRGCDRRSSHGRARPSALL